MANDNVERLSSVESNQFDTNWLELAHPDHFWMQYRFELTTSVLNKMNIPLVAPLLALDVGCGRGTVRRQFESASQWTIDGADLDMDSLSQADSARGRTLFYDITEQNSSLQSHYDAVIAFDILEHIEKPADFVASLLSHLKPGGHLIVNVPAMQWLMSDYDRTVGHFRRYSKKTLLADIGQPIIYSQYWGLTMVPLLLLRKLLLRFISNPAIQVRTGFQPPAKFFNKFLLSLLRIEKAITQQPSIGTSLFAVIQKT